MHCHFHSLFSGVCLSIWTPQEPLSGLSVSYPVWCVWLLILSMLKVYTKSLDIIFCCHCWLNFLFFIYWQEVPQTRKHNGILEPTLNIDNKMVNRDVETSSLSCINEKSWCHQKFRRIAQRRRWKANYQWECRSRFKQRVKFFNCCFRFNLAGWNRQCSWLQVPQLWYGWGFCARKKLDGRPLKVHKSSFSF